MDLEKIKMLQDLSRIPSNDGQQFIHVYLNLTYGESGDIYYGFEWKRQMGTLEFRSLGDAISKVKELRKGIGL